MTTSMNLFLTCGSGLEPFVVQELHEKFKDSLVTRPNSETGKIFITIPSTGADAVIVRLIRDVKVIERLFGVILTRKEVSKIKSRHEVATYLFNTVSSPEIKDVLETWRILKTQINTPNNTDDGEKMAKKSRLDVRFRVNTKISGKFSRICRDSRDIARCVGAAIVKNVENWQVDLRHPEVDLNLYITDAGIHLSMALTTKPISERQYLRHIPLRSTVASAMGLLLQRHLWENQTATPVTIIDPMCGTATILVELALSYKFKIYRLFGMDNSLDQLARAIENIGLAQVDVSLLLGDARRPYPVREAVDGVVCDLPFGQQHGSSESNVKSLLPNILLEMDTILRPGGFVVLLFSHRLSNFLNEVVKAGPTWENIENFPVKLGELLANIHVFRKSVEASL